MFGGVYTCPKGPQQGVGQEKWRITWNYGYFQKHPMDWHNNSMLALKNTMISKTKRHFTRTPLDLFHHFGSKILQQVRDQLTTDYSLSCS